MFIHIGNRRIISESKVVGIFNRESIEKSVINDHLKVYLSDDIKTIVVDEKNQVYTSGVSPFTIIKRKRLNEGIVWSRNNVR